jgi:hypothetical protein
MKWEDGRTVKYQASRQTPLPHRYLPSAVFSDTHEQPELTFETTRKTIEITFRFTCLGILCILLVGPVEGILEYDL